MSKSNVLTVIGETFSRSRLEQMCKAMGLEDWEREVIINRFHLKNKIAVVDSLTPQQHKTEVPKLTNRVRSWLCSPDHNFFTIPEIIMLCENATKSKVKIL